MIINSVQPKTSIIKFTQGNNQSQVLSLPQDKEEKKHDKLWNSDIISKTRANIENTVSIPEYALNGLKGDPDFNFFEYLQVAKIPYYIGGIALAAIALASRNGLNTHAAKQNTQMFKKILTGVAMYYASREVANATIDGPVKWFRGIDLNHPYKKVTTLREGNPLNRPEENNQINPNNDPNSKMNLPNNQKKSHQKVFESVEFTRWDLLYKYKNDPENNPKNEPVNVFFDKIAKKFGAEKYSTDSDSKIKGKIKELVIMANSWKYMLTAPFVTLGLGLAYQDDLYKMDLKNILDSTLDFVKLPKYARQTGLKDKFIALKTALNTGFAQPIGKAFVSLWKGHTLASKIVGRSAIIASVALPIIANATMLHKTSLKNNGGNN